MSGDFFSFCTRAPVAGMPYPSRQIRAALDPYDLIGGAETSLFAALGTFVNVADLFSWAIFRAEQVGKIMRELVTGAN
jgi:hypothetical protein